MLEEGLARVVVAVVIAHERVRTDQAEPAEQQRDADHPAMLAPTIATGDEASGLWSWEPAPLICRA